MTQQRSSHQQRRHPRSASEQLPTQVEIRYVKSSFSHVSHADGVWGGLTPHGLVYMAFFSEHAEIPDSAQIAVDAVAKTFKTVTQPDQEGVWIREVEGEVIMNLVVARAFRNWLDHKIKLLEQHRPEDILTSVEGQEQL